MVWQAASRLNTNSAKTEHLIMVSLAELWPNETQYQQMLSRDSASHDWRHATQ
jgi:hypothetical protein